LTADIAKGLKMMTIDRESVRKMRTGDLARAKRKAASDREHAKQEISKAWQEGVDTGVMEIFREAKEAWQRVINSLEEDIQVIQDELDRRARRRAWLGNFSLIGAALGVELVKALGVAFDPGRAADGPRWWA
jgi:hypothetical protein